MIYPSSVLNTPPEVIKEFNSLVFDFLWNGKDSEQTFYLWVVLKWLTMKTW